MSKLRISIAIPLFVLAACGAEDDPCIGNDCVCEGADSCSPSCEPGTSCDVQCGAGACDVSCGEVTSCDVQGSSGAVTVDCGGATDCDVQCASGNCEVDCTGVTTCNVHCSGDCRVHGCPDASCDVVCGFTPATHAGTEVSCP